MPAGKLAGCQMPWAFREEILGLASHSSLLLAAWDRGIPSTRCHTVHSGFVPCLCRAQRHHSACTLHLRNACAPPLKAFPNPCINIIYEGCLGQNGLCNHLLEMFFQAYKNPHLVKHLLAGKHVRWQECYYIVLETDLVG